MACGNGTPKPSSKTAVISQPDRDRLVMENLAEVTYIAKRIHSRVPDHVDLDDMVEAGVVGLLEAINHYDPSRNIKLMTFAKLRIEGAILDSLRDLDWSPRELRKRGRQLEDALHRLRSRMARAPAPDEIADEMGMSLSSLDHLLCELHGLDLGSLEAMTSQSDHNDQPGLSIPCREEDPLGLYLESEWREVLAQALSELPERDRQVISLYYAEDLTMKEVGAALGVGEGRISQIHGGILLRLRSRLQALLTPPQSCPRQTVSLPACEQLPEWGAVQPWMVSAAA